MKRFLPKSEFGRNVLTLMTGTVIAQAIPIILTPILTRVYTPENFGILAIYMTIISIIGIIITGRYELAIVLPRSNKAALDIFSASLYISSTITIASLILVYFFWSDITELLNQPVLTYWIYSAPIIGFIVGLQQILTYWKIRQKNFKSISASKITQSLTSSLSQVLFGLVNFGPRGLIIGYIFGLTLSTIPLLKKNNITLGKNKLRIIRLLKKYIKFPTFNLTNALLDSFRNSSIIFLITLYFGLHHLGLYILAWRMLALPVSLISASIAEPYYQKISTLKANETHTLTLTIIKKLAIISSAVYLAIFFLSPTIFELFFGDEWREAGEMASVMTPWVFMSFISSPLAHIYSRYNKQNVMLAYSLIYMLIPMISLFLLRNSQTLTALTSTSLLMCLFLISYIYRTLGFLKSHHD